jgi:hydrogenase maturation protease
MMGDDGVGHEVTRRLSLSGVPKDVRLAAIDGDVLALASLWEGEPDVWLVDAVSSGSRPGSFRFFGHRDLLALSEKDQSAHQLSLGESVRWLLHGRPEMATIRFRLCGIEIGDPSPQSGLSSEVDDGVNRLVEELQDSIHV